jgi:heptosyltransferase-1
MKVLIVKISALGDIAHALPVLAHMHAVIPDVTVDWLVEERFASLLDEHPLLNRTICVDTRGWRTRGPVRAVTGATEVIRRLRAEKYDVALDLQGNSKSGLFTLLCGARQRFGFDRDQAREWPNLLATNRKVAIPPSEYHISDRYLQIAKSAFPGESNISPCGPLPVRKQAARTVAGLLEELDLQPGRFLAAHPGTTWQTKLWPLDLWSGLVRILSLDYGERVVLTWGNNLERQAAASIAEGCQGRVHVWPRGSLPELVALLKQARLVIGTDTGPVHLAAAVGTPTVSLYRVTDGRRNGPPGDHHVWLQAPMECSPCMAKSCERDHECGESLSVDTVLHSVLTLLERQTLQRISS